MKVKFCCERCGKEVVVSDVTLKHLKRQAKKENEKIICVSCYEENPSKKK